MTFPKCTTALPMLQVGDLQVQAISDGYLGASLALLSNIEPVQAKQLQDHAGVADAAAIHINCYLVRGRGRTVLIDAGAGGRNGWGGHLQANLARAGVQPADIDTILLTHAHPDHIGGLLDTQGQCVFPDAELRVHPRELAFWEDDSQLARASERARGNFQFARQVFAAYRRNLRPCVEGDVVPGIRALPLPGHTPGHTGYRVDAGGEGALVWGDIVHFPHIQLAQPQVGIAFDQDGALAADTRARLLDVVSADGLRVAGMHLGEAGFACIRRQATGYAIDYLGA